MRSSISFQSIRLHLPFPAIAPPLAGTDSYRRALANALVFVLVALAGEWIVHQLEYLIEYREQFNTVMEMTPHRMYMAPLGVLFAILGVLVLGIVAGQLHTDSVKRQRLLHLLPQWMRWLLPAHRLRIPVRNAGATVLALAGMQVSVYLLQENWEWYDITGTLPGLAVLLAPEHATVLPLHVLTACVASLLLWTLATWRRAVCLGVALGELLLHLTLRWQLPSQTTVPVRLHVPRRRLAATHRSLRSPPLAA
jgi:hypothetical protein